MKTFENYEIIHVEEVDSTNNYVRSMADSFPEKEFVVVTADFQTSGRGQRGNSWESEKKKNLLFSIVCHPTFLEANRQFILSQVISLSIKEELEHHVKKISIKWPNDIYWREKKIGGILIENDLEGKHIASSIIGVGINLNQLEFASDAPNPVSLLQATGQSKDADTILRKILGRFECYYRKLEEGQAHLIAELYRKSLLRKRGYYMFRDKDGLFGARIHHIEPDGHIVLLDTEKNLRRYSFKEVHYIFEQPKAD